MLAELLIGRLEEIGYLISTLTDTCVLVTKDGFSLTLSIREPECSATLYHHGWEPRRGPTFLLADPESLPKLEEFLAAHFAKEHEPWPWPGKKLNPTDAW